MASEPKGILASVQLPPPFRKKLGPFLRVGGAVHRIRQVLSSITLANVIRGL